jgi:hypothetical protein
MTALHTRAGTRLKMIGCDILAKTAEEFGRIEG